MDKETAVSFDSISQIYWCRGKPVGYIEKSKLYISAVPENNQEAEEAIMSFFESVEKWVDKKDMVTGGSQIQFYEKATERFAEKNGI